MNKKPALLGWNPYGKRSGIKRDKENVNGIKRKLAI